MDSKEVTTVFLFSHIVTAVGGSLVQGQQGLRNSVLQLDKLILTDGSEVPYGLIVWSTSVGPTPFVKDLKLPKSPGGRYFFLKMTTWIVRSFFLRMVKTR